MVPNASVYPWELITFVYYQPQSHISPPPVLPIMVLHCHRCGSYCRRTATPLEARTPRLGIFVGFILGSPKGGHLFSFNPILRQRRQVYLRLGWIIFEWHSPDHNQNCTDNLTKRERTLVLQSRSWLNQNIPSESWFSKCVWLSSG